MLEPITDGRITSGVSPRLGRKSKLDLMRSNPWPGRLSRAIHQHHSWPSRMTVYKRGHNLSFLSDCGAKPYSFLLPFGIGPLSSSLMDEFTPSPRRYGAILKGCLCRGRGNVPNGQISGPISLA